VNFVDFVLKRDVCYRFDYDSNLSLLACKNYLTPDFFININVTTFDISTKLSPLIKGVLNGFANR
jgi:hypothetical protein